MSTVAVFVFLLDNLAGFNNALNETLVNNANFSQTIPPILQDCDPVATDLIITAVSQDLDLEMVPTFKTNDVKTFNHDDFERSQENLYNAVLENSLPERDNLRDELMEKPAPFFEEYIPFYRHNKESGGTEHTGVTELGKPDFPKSAPFLVAIFETLSNVTAQTCAGTLITPGWVLTAANCVNILSNLYSNNSTNTSATSQHTVIADSTNPLLDGSVHNVTAVILHPSLNSSRPAHKSPDLDGPYLALMKIVPDVAVRTLPVMEENLILEDVMVYGWILSKNDSGYESLNMTSLSAKVRPSQECKTLYSFKNSDVICLHNNDKDKNITQFSSGGPVLMMHNDQVKMLGVVQTDEHLFVAYPLLDQVEWINQTITNTTNT